MRKPPPTPEQKLVEALAALLQQERSRMQILHEQHCTCGGAERARLAEIRRQLAA